MSASTRYSINRAQKLHATMCTCDCNLEAFYKLYIGTRRNLGLPAQPISYFKNLIRYLEPRKKIIMSMVYFEDIPVASLLGFVHGQRFSIEFNGWDRSLSKHCLNYLVWWHAIETSKNNRLKIIDFGRTARKNTGLMAFKNKWGTFQKNITQCHCRQNTTHLLPYKQSSILYRTVQKACKNLPHPGYKWLSSLCYRHLG